MKNQYYKNTCRLCKQTYLSMEKRENQMCNICYDNHVIKLEQEAEKRKFIQDCLRRQLEVTMFGDKFVMKDSEDMKEAFLKMFYNLAEEIYELKKIVLHDHARTKYNEDRLLNAFEALSSFKKY